MPCEEAEVQRIPVCWHSQGRQDTEAFAGSAFKAQERGSTDFRLDEQSKIGVIKWFDNSSVHLVSSYASVQLTEICKRWNTKEKCSVNMFQTLSS